MGRLFDFRCQHTDPNLKCGYHKVPMDYHDNAAGHARLAVIKYSATADEKKGVLFANPGTGHMFDHDDCC